MATINSKKFIENMIPTHLKIAPLLLNGRPIVNISLNLICPYLTYKVKLLSMVYLIYLLTGIIAGTLSGLFGIGGGLIIVPALLYSFRSAQFPPELSMIMAVGTSLMIILVTVSSSVYGHHKLKNIDWKISRKIFTAILIGSFCGSFVSKQLAAKTLEVIFSTYVILVSIKMLMEVKVEGSEKQTSSTMYNVVGFIIGFKSTILGIGGGTISIPFLTWRGFPMKKAVGVSASLGLPIALGGAISYMINGWGTPGLPKYSAGYVYLPAVLGVVIVSPIFARIGAKLSSRLPQRQMKRGFALFLVVIAVKMIFF
jgi:uncharacterized membrane protein YfcA